VVDGIQEVHKVMKVYASASEHVRQYMDLEHCVHWLYLGPTHLLYYNVYTWSPPI
jgi:hypothetical protein